MQRLDVVIDLEILGRDTQTRGAGVLEDHELGFEEDVAEDGDADAGVSLDAAEASWFQSVTKFFISWKRGAWSEDKKTYSGH